MTAYGEFRSGYNEDEEDQRIVVYGIRYMIEQYVSRKWSKESLANAKKFFATHHTGGTPFPWPEKLFEKVGMLVR